MKPYKKIFVTAEVFVEEKMKTVVRRDDEGKIKKQRVVDYRSKGHVKQKSSSERREIGRKVKLAKQHTTASQKAKSKKKRAKSFKKGQQLGLHK